MTKVAVVGTGYVGLVSAACFAKLGVEVVGYDVNEAKIAKLSAGESPIFEPGLEPLLRECLDAGNLRFTTDLRESIVWADVVFVCVGTPQSPDGSADLSQVEAVARTIAEHLDRYKLIVEKSTVPVKTAQWIRRTIELFKKGNVPFSVASNPEFLREGSAVHDFLHPDRVVLGVEDERARDLLLGLYAGIDCPKLVVDVETAEIIKHASNSFLATKISFINMVADLCEIVGADITKVAEGMGLDDRIGPRFLQAGIGYGGSCFPKDVRAFVRIAESHGVDFSLLKAVDAINTARIPRVVERLRDVLWVLRDKTVALWGLAFKPNTDDVREAAALRLAHALLGEGAQLKAWDPEATETFAAALGTHDAIVYCDSPLKAAVGAHAVVVVTEWDELRTVDPLELKAVMATPIIVDGRNHLDAQAYLAAGFDYRGIGRFARGVAVS